MIRERIGQAALRAYPPAVRQARGLEMLGMLLDAGEQSRRAFGRETGSLMLGGLRARRAIVARAGTRRLIADSCCQAVLIFLTLWIISALNTEVIAGPSQQLRIQELVLAAILACALIGYERIAAVSGLAAIVAFGPLGPHTQLVEVAKVLVPIACLLVMASAPRKRPRDLRQLLWLLPVGALAALGPYAQRQPAGSSCGHLPRRTASTPPRSTASHRVQPGLDHPPERHRGPTGPGRRGLARHPRRHGCRTRTRRPATLDDAPQRDGVANPPTPTSSREAQS